MSEIITIAGLEIPKAAWDATPASVQAVVRVLSERLSHIEEQLKQNFEKFLPSALQRYLESEPTESGRVILQPAPRTQTLQRHSRQAGAS